MGLQPENGLNRSESEAISGMSSAGPFAPQKYIIEQAYNSLVAKASR